MITCHGQLEAVLLPVDEQWLAEEPRRAAEATAPGEDVWAALGAIRKEIGDSWQSAKPPWSLCLNSVAREHGPGEL